MSVRCTTWATYDVRVENHFHHRVLMFLCDVADEHGGTCYPGMRRIAEYCCASIGGVRQAIKALEDAGLIVVERPAQQGRGNFNRYGIVMGRDPADVLAMVRRGGNDETPLSASVSTPPGPKPAAKVKPSSGGTSQHNRSWQLRQQQAGERLADLSLPERKDVDA